MSSDVHIILNDKAYSYTGDEFSNLAHEVDLLYRWATSPPYIIIPLSRSYIGRILRAGDTLDLVKGNVAIHAYQTVGRFVVIGEYQIYNTDKPTYPRWGLFNYYSFSWEQMLHNLEQVEALTPNSDELRFMRIDRKTNELFIGVAPIKGESQ